METRKLAEKLLTDGKSINEYAEGLIKECFDLKEASPSLTWKVQGKKLVIKADKRAIADILEDYSMKDLRSDKAMYDILDDVVSNGLMWVSPEDIGALTDAPILTDFKNIYIYRQYETLSPMQELVKKGKVEFDFSGEYSEEE